MTVYMDGKLKDPEMTKLELEVKALKDALYRSEGDKKDAYELIDDLKKELKAANETILGLVKPQQGE